MELIRELISMSMEEAHGAKQYAKCAVKHKDAHPSLAKVFYDMSGDELKHYNSIHTETEKLIEECKTKDEQAYAEIKAIYDYVCEEQIDVIAKAKNYQSMYREG